MNGRAARAASFVFCCISAPLAGCGGPQIQAPGGLTQSAARVAPPLRGGSWVKPDAKRGDLLYVSLSGASTDVAVFSYPKGKLVGTLTGFGLPRGLCSDKAGDVFITDHTTEQIIEYAHGGADPIRTLDDPGNAPNGCFVDPATGDLAVTGGEPRYSEANIAIYPNATGSPTVYTAPSVGWFSYCTYDAQSNLFAEAGDIYELPSGGDKLQRIEISGGSFSAGDGAIQWDGKYFAVGSPKGSVRGPTIIYQVEISGSTGSVINTIELKSGKKNRNPGHPVQFWLQGQTIITGRAPTGNVGLWHYPAGGYPYRATEKSGATPLGVTISRPPSD